MARIAKWNVQGIDLADNNNFYATVAAPTEYRLAESPLSIPITLQTGGVVIEHLGGGKWQVLGRADGSTHSSILITTEGAESGGTIVKIKEGAFDNDPYLVSITIPNTVTEIGEGAFINCKKLSTVTFLDDDRMPIFFNQGSWDETPKICLTWNSPEKTNPATLEEEMMVFDTTKNIYYYMIPANATYVNMHFKCGDENLNLRSRSFTYSSAEEIDALANCLFSISGGSSPDNNGNIIYNGEVDFNYNPGTNFLEDNGLKIGPSAFYGSTIKELNLPKRTVVIEHNAFEKCYNLKKVEIPSRNRFLAIKGGAFAYCDVLGVLDLKHGIKEIGETAFLDCGCLTTIQFPASLKSIGTSAFMDCDQLSWIWFGTTATRDPSLESIGEGAFARCGALGSMMYGKLILPKSLKYIGKNAFYGISEGEADYARGVHFKNSHTWFTSDNATPGAGTMTRFEPKHLSSGNDDIGSAEPRESENHAKLMTHYVDKHWHRLDQMLRPTLEYDSALNEIKITDPLGIAEEYYIYVSPQAGVVNKYKIEPDSIDNT
jgi:hypothetical protein